jgi:8-oxo-dGTP diphosphatase
MRPAISVTVDIVIFALREGDLQVLLVKRKHPPYEGRWAIPGGYVEADESLEAAAARELYEETHVQGMHIEQLYTFGEPLRDPRGRVVTVAYFALVPAPIEVEAGDDAAEAQWKSVAHLPVMAFDHDQIVAYALKRVRAKLDQPAITHTTEEP